MAKANLTLANGTKVTLEGNAEEITILLEKFSNGISSIGSPKDQNQPEKKKGKVNSKAKTRKGPQDFILELIEEGFFATRRTIGDIQNKLEEKGHIYPQSHLSTPLVRLTRKRELRRMKENKTWVYVA